MSTITLSIANLTAGAPLYHQFPTQVQPQPAYVEIDENGHVSADYAGEIGNAVPMYVWNGRTLRYTVSPSISGAALAEYLADAVELIEQIHAGHTIEWDGSNMIGRLSADARAASERLESELEALSNDCAAQTWTADEWLFSSCRLADHWPAGCSLDECVAEIQALASAEGVVIVDDVRECLLSHAAEMARDAWRTGPGSLALSHIDTLLAEGRITAEEAEEARAEIAG